MEFLWVFLALTAVSGLVLLAAYICYRLTFYVKRPQPVEQYPVPKGSIYEAYRDVIIARMEETRQMPCEIFQTISFDGLTLQGKYYELDPQAPIELMFHGYRGSAERDLSGSVQRCFRLGHSCLLVDQRCSGGSGGHVTTLGILESRDCHSWIAFLQEHFGPDVRILLTGISMGAATVLQAAGGDLPNSVIGVIADCGFTTPKAIIQKVLGQIKLPSAIFYPLIKLGAKVFGHFDLEDGSPLESMGRCQVPVLFFHGDQDDFVPCHMSRELHAACQAPKCLMVVPGAGHGLSYLLDPEGYRKTLTTFFAPYMQEKVKP